MAATLDTGRANQKRRTRKALLEAATRLTRRGLNPTLEEVAEEALVSRATAYRYFQSVEDLLLEAALDVAVPTPDELFADGGPSDLLARVERVETALHDMMCANEGPMRRLLLHSLERQLQGDVGDGVPARQNRRSPLIEAALAPMAGELSPTARKRLAQALAVVVGVEALVALKDVLQLDDPEARAVKRWTIRALVDAALRSSPAD